MARPSRDHVPIVPARHVAAVPCYECKGHGRHESATQKNNDQRRQGAPTQTGLSSADTLFVSQNVFPSLGAKIAIREAFRFVSETKRAFLRNQSSSGAGSPTL